MLSSLPCFYAFCWSAIPTSCYIFNVFYSSSCLFFSSRCMLELKFAIYHRAASLSSQASHAVLAEESLTRPGSLQTPTVFLIQQSCVITTLLRFKGSKVDACKPLGHSINNSTMNSELTRGEWQVMKCSKWLPQSGQGFVPTLGLVRVQYKDWRASVPREPWSRAILHNLGQVILILLKSIPQRSS